MRRNRQVLDRLTDEQPPAEQRRADLRRFAHENGWRPSYEILDHYGTKDLANGHLVVEHGLRNTAVITFLKRPYNFGTLPLEAQRQVLSVSYNNLIEWQLFPDITGMTWVYSLRWPVEPAFTPLVSDRAVWRAEAFDRLVGRKPNPNVRNLEDALIWTISKWKRILKSEIPRLSNPNISSLFNCILFIRAIEDIRRWRSTSHGRLLLDTFSLRDSRTLRSCVTACLAKLGMRKFPSQALGKEDELRPFDGLTPDTVRQLLTEFYENPSAPYPYDFSLISKHALSRVYEHYVSVLRERTTSQMQLFPELPDEVRDASLGGIYTPHYIARFFGRVLQESHTPPAFRNLRIADPTCGSGMFLRTLLEMQCDPLQGSDVTKTAKRQFRGVLGIDVDPNACRATRLSLALLHLVLTDSLPSKLAIYEKEAIAYFSSHPKTRRAFDAVIANPPFVKWDKLGGPLRRRISTVLGAYGGRKPDMYLAHLKIGLEMTKPGGYLLYVLPHSFLLSEVAFNLRREIQRNWSILFLVDLSQIPVFGDVGSYVVLLVLQRPSGTTPLTQNRTAIVRCKALVGEALEKAVEGIEASNEQYSVYRLPQQNIGDGTWEVLSPAQLSVRKAIENHPPLGDFLAVREGFITGDDEVFVRRASAISAREKAIYAPYLPDREMTQYTVPARTDLVVFYPYLHHRKITARILRDNFPDTWAYLRRHKARLQKRKSAASKATEWWCPVRPRKPDNMMRPKIISPHLVLLPRFSLDESGKYAVSRSPLLYPLSSGDDVGLLRYFLAILNSPVVFWQILRSSHRYRRGYAMLEPKTLKQIRVPDPRRVPTELITRLHSLVDQRIRLATGNRKIEDALDNIVADIYGLSEKDREELQLKA